MQPIALIGHHHTCPARCGRTPHVGGPVITGQPNVTVNGIPVACISDQLMCNCGGPDIVAGGSSLVTINGLPVARLGDPTAHGGVIVQGDPLVTLV